MGSEMCIRDSPSGTEDKYKIYAESLRDADHLAAVQEEARHIVDQALKG